MYPHLEIKEFRAGHTVIRAGSNIGDKGLSQLQDAVALYRSLVVLPLKPRTKGSHHPELQGCLGETAV
jgi:hypothetical protein